MSLIYEIMVEHEVSTYLMLLPEDLMSWTISLWRKPSTDVSFTLAIVSPTNPRKTVLNWEQIWLDIV